MEVRSPLYRAGYCRDAEQEMGEGRWDMHVGDVCPCPSVLDLADSHVGAV